MNKKAKVKLKKLIIKSTFLMLMLITIILVFSNSRFDYDAIYINSIDNRFSEISFSKNETDNLVLNISGFQVNLLNDDFKSVDSSTWATSYTMKYPIEIQKNKAIIDEIGLKIDISKNKLTISTENDELTPFTGTYLKESKNNIRKIKTSTKYENDPYNSTYTKDNINLKLSQNEDKSIFLYAYKIDSENQSDTYINIFKAVNAQNYEAVETIDGFATTSTINIEKNKLKLETGIKNKEIFDGTYTLVEDNIEQELYLRYKELLNDFNFENDKYGYIISK